MACGAHLTRGPHRPLSHQNNTHPVLGGCQHRYTTLQDHKVYITERGGLHMHSVSDQTTKPTVVRLLTEKSYTLGFLQAIQGEG